MSDVRWPMTASRKRCHAVNGDVVVIEHPDLDLAAPFTSHVDVVFDGLTHQVLATADLGAFNFEHVTGEFTAGDHRGYIIEALDTVATQATHVYRGVVPTDSGVISVHGYQSVEDVLSLLGALRPSPTRLGVVIEPEDTVEITSVPKVALQTDIGVLEIVPLTAEIIDGLPQWSGSAVPGGELFVGRLSDEAPFLILVTATARGILMLDPSDDLDEIASTLGQTTITWST